MASDVGQKATATATAGTAAAEDPVVGTQREQRRSSSSRRRRSSSAYGSSSNSNKHHTKNSRGKRAEHLTRPPDPFPVGDYHHNVMVDQHLGPVDRLLLLVADGQSLSRRVLGNERQSARLGERLSCLKNPLWQLQARVRTQAETPPEFIHKLTEEVSHCLSVLLELTHPDWWNQIRRKVKNQESEKNSLRSEIVVVGPC